MAAVGSEVTASWLMASGSSSFLLLLLLLFILSIFLTVLCTDCGRRSFELQDPDVGKTPSALIRVVRLEDAMGARENPMILEIQNDEKDVVPVSNGPPAVREPESASDSSRPADSESELNPEEENWYTPWRSHLGALQQQEANGAPSSGQHRPPATNQEPASCDEGGVSALSSGSLAVEAGEDLSDSGVNPVYARVSRKVRGPSPPPAPPPALPVDEQEEEEPLPSLPERKCEG